MEFANFRISPQILFEAVTFELPVEISAMKEIYETDPSDSGTWKQSMALTDYCTEHACYTRNPISRQDQVRLLPRCVAYSNEIWDHAELIDGCTYISNSSVYVISVAHHISANEIQMCQSPIHAFGSASQSGGFLGPPKILLSYMMLNAVLAQTAMASTFQSTQENSISCSVKIMYPLHTIHMCSTSLSTKHGRASLKPGQVLIPSLPT